ncbi:LppA family lipoprotein [Nocardia asteroides]|uniref:LppA family lipoprotein n=1 Tax=Nocardia asteroides TaxID=1824 RepID=UPI003435A3B4
MTGRVSRVVALIGLASALVAGCSEKAEMEEQQLQQMEDRIRSWPSAEDTQRTLIDMSAEMAAAISGRVPGFEFERSGSVGPAPCGEYHRNRIGAVATTIPSLSVVEPIPDAAWPGVHDAVRAIAAAHGFSDSTALADKPGSRIARFFDGTGSEITVGYIKATVISGQTGCRLRADGGAATTTR